MCPWVDGTGAAAWRLAGIMSATVAAMKKGNSSARSQLTRLATHGLLLTDEI
jgi:hypothetical protein